MNHFNTSFIKSIIRILGSIAGLISAYEDKIQAGVILLAGGLIIAEAFGILEEILDKRKED